MKLEEKIEINEQFQKQADEMIELILKVIKMSQDHNREFDLDESKEHIEFLKTKKEWMNREIARLKIEEFK